MGVDDRPAGRRRHDRRPARRPHAARQAAARQHRPPQDRGDDAGTPRRHPLRGRRDRRQRRRDPPLSYRRDVAAPAPGGHDSASRAAANASRLAARRRDAACPRVDRHRPLAAGAITFGVAGRRRHPAISRGARHLPGLAARRCSARRDRLTSTYSVWPTRSPSGAVVIGGVTLLSMLLRLVRRPDAQRAARRAARSCSAPRRRSCA